MMLTQRKSSSDSSPGTPGGYPWVPIQALRAFLALAVMGPMAAASANWAIDGEGKLLWDGVPYAPVGQAISGTPEAVAQARASGVTDVVVSVGGPGAEWKTLSTSLRESGLRFLWRVSARAPAGFGIEVRPDAFRIAPVRAGTTYQSKSISADKALVLLASRRDGSVLDRQLVEVKDGIASFRFDSLKGESDSIVLLYPIGRNIDRPAIGQPWDEYRDKMVMSLSQAETGPNLRGIIDPYGAFVDTSGEGFVPFEERFRAEFAQLLRERYKDQASVVATWGISASEVTEFDLATETDTGKPRYDINALARLVPLWYRGRGVSYLYDPVTDQIFACDQRKSAIWNDLSDAYRRTLRKRMTALTQAIKTVANVPILTTWRDWSSAELLGPIADGFSYDAPGDQRSRHFDVAARAAAAAWKFGKKWYLGAEVAAGPSEVAGALSDTQSIGASGVFFTSAPPAGSQLERIALNPFFFPENAWNPAAPQSLPGGRFWLPSPVNGNRIDFGASFYAYRIREDNGNDAYVLWTTTPQRVRLLLNQNKTVTFETLDGSDPKPKPFAKGVEVEVNGLPLIVRPAPNDMPIPEPVMAETVAGIEQVVRSREDLSREFIQEAAFYNQYLGAVERNPGGAYSLLRPLLYRVLSKSMGFFWYEAESLRDSLYSEPRLEGSASSGAVLSGMSRMQTPVGFGLSIRPAIRIPGNYELWVAGRIPAEIRSQLTASAIGLSFPFTTDPISPYGDGFAWFKVADLTLERGTTPIDIRLDGTSSSPIDFDVVLLIPQGYRPLGAIPNLYRR
jgi:hypothetical protein